MNIRCGKCKGHHVNVAQVRACHLVTTVADLLSWPEAKVITWVPAGHPDRAKYEAHVWEIDGDNAPEAILAADEAAEDWQWFAEVGEERWSYTTELAAERADAVAVAR